MAQAQEIFNANSIDQVGDIFAGIFDGIEIQFQEADYTEPLTETLGLLQEQHQVMYDSGQDSNGSAWAPLAPSTIARKGHATILVDKNKMKASLVSETGDSIRDVVSESGSGGAVFGTDVEYAGFHVTGTSRMPARPPVGISERTIDQVTSRVADHTVAAITG